MTEHVLPYNRAIVPQETGYWCGPAATQVVLDSRGIRVAETDLAREIGTHTGGTDHIGLIMPSLHRRLPDAHYTQVPMRNDPPTAGQRDRLWRDIVRSIDAGYGVVVNWVAPPSNYPRGVKGSVSPRYGGGTVYHYVAVMGYDDNPALRAVWVADSGFQPQGYWLAFDQLATLIPPKDYAYADADAVAAPAPAEPGGLDALVQAMQPSGVSRGRIAELLPAVAQALVACDCRTPRRRAMWLAQIGHESSGLYYMEEIASGAAYEGRVDLGNTQPGDGVRFKGRGPIQVTGRHNYTELSAWAHREGLVPTPTYFVDRPDELASDRYGFIGVIWYWTVARPQLNALADAGDLDGATRAINGGLHGLPDRRDRYNRCLALGEQLMTITEGDEFMAALTPEEQREMLFLLRIQASNRWVSRSPLRHLGEGPTETVAGFGLNTDANLHVVLVKSLAEIGDPDALALLREVAGADPARYPDRRADAELAQRILARIDTGGTELDEEAAGRASARLASSVVTQAAASGSHPATPEPVVRAGDDRIAVLTFSGTGAPSGVGPASDVVARADASRVYEVPSPGPHSFGPVPVTPDLNDPKAPSYEESEQIDYEWACQWVRDHPGVRVVLGGYSQGAQSASRVAMEFLTGSLRDEAHRFVGGYTFGNPSRREGAGPGGVAGRGIADESKRMTEVPDTWADYALAGDMYTTASDDTYLTIGYLALTKLQLHDPLELAQAMFQLITSDLFTDALAELLPVGTPGLLDVLGELTGQDGSQYLAGRSPLSGGLLGPLVTGGTGFVGGLLSGIPQLGQAGKILGGLLGGGSGPGGTTNGWVKMGRTVAALTDFLARNPHIRYDDPAFAVFDGQTAVAHAVGHLNAITAAVPATA